MITTTARVIEQDLDALVKGTSVTRWWMVLREKMWHSVYERPTGMRCEPHGDQCEACRDVRRYLRQRDEQ